MPDSACKVEMKRAEGTAKRHTNIWEAAGGRGPARAGRGNGRRQPQRKECHEKGVCKSAKFQRKVKKDEH